VVTVENGGVSESSKAEDGTPEQGSAQSVAWPALGAFFDEAFRAEAAAAAQKLREVRRP
jgi:hypothetical protein